MLSNLSRMVMEATQQLEIVVEATGERLDVYLAEEFEELSRSRIQKLIGQGQVQVNQIVCTSKKELLRRGDRLIITIPEVEPLQLEPEAIALDILYEDDALLIVNKPAGMVVHPAPGHTTGTLVNALLGYCRNSQGECTLSGIGGVQRPGIVHRLDKDTTGAIAIAKTDYAHQHLQQQFQTKIAKRTYLGVVYGVPKSSTGTINAPIGRHPGDSKKMAVVSGSDAGRPAVTHWQIQERLGNYTLMQFSLETGRTHQIRVHTAHIGHPIVGDPVYGSGRSLGINLPGQALHAWRLQLYHPVTEKPIEAIAPLPKSFQTLINILRNRCP